MHKVTDEQLTDIRKNLPTPRAWQIKDVLKNQFNVELDESTIRGRFIEMGCPLSEQYKPLATKQITIKQYVVPDELRGYIPKKEMFTNYIERGIDKRLSVHYEKNKYPISQGKQGTGKTFSHMYYAYKAGLPFFLFSCYENMKLRKLFGDKTIINGNVVFKEGLFVKAIQSPCVILFDEINAIENSSSFDFHALLENRELFVKDADDGNGRIYKLHPDCKIGFAQNPKSAKYLGGNIKPSNFLGRCTYLTYPEFTKKEIDAALKMKFPDMPKDDRDKFSTFYFACCETIEKASIPVDISIRQLNNIVELWGSGLSLKEAIEDGLTSILEAISQPKAKESFFRLAQAVWKELMSESQDEKVGKISQLIMRLGGML